LLQFFAWRRGRASIRAGHCCAWSGTLPAKRTRRDIAVVARGRRRSVNGAIMPAPCWRAISSSRSRPRSACSTSWWRWTWARLRILHCACPELFRGSEAPGADAM